MGGSRSASSQCSDCARSSMSSCNHPNTSHTSVSSICLPSRNLRSFSINSSTEPAGFACTLHPRCSSSSALLRSSACCSSLLKPVSLAAWSHPCCQQRLYVPASLAMGTPSRATLSGCMAPHVHSSRCAHSSSMCASSASAVSHLIGVTPRMTVRVLPDACS